MTREEAIKRIDVLKFRCERLGEKWIREWKMDAGALDLALSALRPVSREQVEELWRGEWIVQQDEHREFIKKCSKCGFPISGWWGADKFCANCGEAFTDEAVEMVMERLNKLEETKK